MFHTLKRSVDAEGKPYFMHLIKDKLGNVLHTMTYREYNLPSELRPLLS